MPAKKRLTPAMERRFQPRARVEIEAQYRVSSGEPWKPALIQDLGGGGTSALIDDGLALGTALAGFRFMVPDDVDEWPLMVCAQVVRCGPAEDASRPFLARFRFLPPAPREIDTVRRFVHRALHGDAADRVPIEVPPYESVARASADNRLARRLDAARREGAARERHRTAGGSEVERAHGVLEKRIAALEDALLAAVSTEERLRAEIRRSRGRRTADAPAAKASEPEELERLRRERDALARQVEELGRRHETERSRPEGELETVSTELEAARVNTSERQLAVLRAERPLLPPRPVGRESGLGRGLITLTAGLLLGALAILAWQRFGAAPAAQVAAAVEPTVVEPPHGAETAAPDLAVDPPAASAAKPVAPEPDRDSSAASSTMVSTAITPSEPATPEPVAATAALATVAPKTTPHREPSAAAPVASPQPSPGAIKDTVEAWAAAWSDRRVDDYLALYSEDFQTPSGISRSDWEASRRRSLIETPRARVTISRLRHLMIDESRARVDFVQRYETASLRFEDTSSIEVVWVDGSWKIRRELRGALDPSRPRP